jgi:hypothetical protein
MHTDKKYSFIRVHPWPKNNPRSYQTHAEARQNIHSVVISAIDGCQAYADRINQHSPSVAFSIRQIQEQRPARGKCRGDMRAWEHTGVDAVAIHDPQIESAERGHHVYAIAAVLDIEGRYRERSNGVNQQVAKFQTARHDRAQRFDGTFKTPTIEEGTVPLDPSELQVVIPRKRCEPVHFPVRHQRKNQRSPIARDAEEFLVAARFAVYKHRHQGHREQQQ